MLILSEGGVRNAAGMLVNPRESGGFLIVRARVRDENGEFVRRSCSVHNAVARAFLSDQRPPGHGTATPDRLAVHPALEHAL